MSGMEVMELAKGWSVWLDVGHSAAVRGIEIVGDLVISGGLDGAVLVRGPDGRSRLPGLHLPEVWNLAVLPGSDLLVIGTEGQTYGLDPERGTHRAISGFENVRVRCSAAVSSAVMLGCDDGSVRSIDRESAPRILARFGSPVRGLMAVDDTVVTTFEDGHVRVLGLEGAVRCTWTRSPGELATLAASPTRIVLGGIGEPKRGKPLSGQLVAFDHDGRETARRALDVCVEAVICVGEDVFAMLGNGDLLTTTTALAEPTTLARRRDAGISCMVARRGEVWLGGYDGSVSRLDPPRDLPSIASRVFATSVSEDQRAAVTTDGKEVVVWDLRTGRATHRHALPGVRAVTFAEDTSDDLVLAFLDGRLERRIAPEYDQVSARTELTDRPRELGYVGPFVIAQGPDPDQLRMFDADDLTELTPTPAALADRCVMERCGYPFVGTGLLTGVELSIIDGRELVVQRPGLLTATSGATSLVRVWDGERFRN